MVTTLPACSPPKPGSQHPDDDHRQAALDIGTQGDRNNAADLACPRGWMVKRFHWSPATKQIPIPPYMTARAVRDRGAVQLRQGYAGSERLNPA